MFGEEDEEATGAAEVDDAAAPVPVAVEVVNPTSLPVGGEVTVVVVDVVGRGSGLAVLAGSVAGGTNVTAAVSEVEVVEETVSLGVVSK